MSTRQRAAATRTKRTKASDEITVTWRGVTYRLPPADEFPLDALEAEEQGKHLTALRLVLGPEQYTTWRKDARTARDAEEFSRDVMTELGAGNR